MTLFKQWQDLIGNQTDDTIQDFWKEYTQAEVKIYSDVLERYETQVTGTIKELYEKYDVTPVLYMGFLDGINSSLKEEMNLDDMTEDSTVTLDIDFEKLYYNMHSAGANHLYDLEQWTPILSEERRSEIAKEYKRSKTVIKEKVPGRNEPCPCGSGKKYKKCCGANN